MKVSTIAAILPASPGVITPAASAAVTGLHRRGDIRRALDRRQLELDRAFAADRQKALDAEPQRHRVAGERRLDGLRVSPSASPASSFAAARVALLREPGRRPAGLPDRPFRNGRPGTCSIEFAKTSSFIFTFLFFSVSARRVSGISCNLNM